MPIPPALPAGTVSVATRALARRDSASSTTASIV
jgi:hypothetical protein